MTEAYHKRLARLGIREKDLSETFVRSGGHGGQNVNKVATCVILTHLLSGISIRCDTERSQAQNRILARERLADRLELREIEKKNLAQSAAERIRRQKRRPSVRARRRNVEAKRLHSKIKQDRRGPKWDE